MRWIVFSVAKSITIGDDVLIACGCTVSDYSQHPLDPEKRLAGMQVDPEDVRPVRIENRAWLGKRAMILPHPRQVDAPTVSLWTWRVVVLHLPLCPAAATE
jgi:acetyltransferase-like isoleucine patch superfamily enzyme